MSLRYTVGAPKSGGVIILNYDHTGISPQLPLGAYYLEGFRPLQFDILELFATSLKKVLNCVGMVPSEHVLLLDISSSMTGMYSGMLNLYALEQCVRSELVEVLFFNEELVEGELNYTGVPRTYGGTNIAKVLYQLRNAKPHLKNR